MTKRTKFGESTVLVSIRVPESKKEEILNRFYSVLNDYILENPFTRKEDKMDTEVFPKWKQDLLQKNSTASGNDKWQDVRATDKEVAEALSNVKVTPEFKFEKIASLPLGTELLSSFGKNGALRTLNDEEYFTKRTHNGKLEILKHENYQSAVLYANENFK